MGPMIDGFWMVLLPWDARNNICLALIGSEYGVKSWSFLILPFFTIFVFFEIFVSIIFENISTPVCFVAYYTKKAMRTCFVANLPSFQKNFKLKKSVAYYQRYA